jgi:hypothetical protein
LSIIFIQSLSKVYPNFIQILSKFYPNFIQNLSILYPKLILKLIFQDMVHLSLNNVAAAAAAAAASSAASSSVAAVAAVAGVGGAGSVSLIPGSTSTPPSGQVVLPPAVALATVAVPGNPSSAVRNVTNLANLPPSERPKAKPSRKIVNNQQNIAAAAANAGGSNGADKSKKCQLQVCQFLDFSRLENL